MRIPVNVVIIACFLSMAASVFFMSAHGQDHPANTTSVTTDNATLPLKDLRLFTQIFEHVRQAYVDPVSDHELLQNAIKGLLNEMDPHSVYLDKGSFEQLQESTQGKFTGVGIEMGPDDDGGIKIIAPIDDSPAIKAGLQAGDRIIKIDQQSIQGIPLSDISQRIRGPAGTSITFTIIRQHIDKPFDVSVVRDTIKSASVRHRIIEEEAAYIRIARFQVSTSKDFTKAVQALLEKKPSLSGFIIDLRNNPGGILQESVQVADSMLNEGLIVSTKGRLPSSNTEFTATAGDDTGGLPVVVLVNGGSASASEIVAGALQDNQRALIMGTRTFGKGSVQSILPIGDHQGIKLTTARYFTPNGHSIQARGIEPDIVVEPVLVTRIGTHLPYTGEANLNRHLKNPDNNEDKRAAQQPDNNASDIKDWQLIEALNLLKGLAIIGKRP